jgi:hypothetical protein
MKECGQGLILNNISPFFWKEQCEPRESSLRKDGFGAEVWVQVYPNMKQDYYPCDRYENSYNPYSKRYKYFHLMCEN